jgi:hypothetical protein
MMRGKADGSGEGGGGIGSCTIWREGRSEYERRVFQLRQLFHVVAFEIQAPTDLTDGLSSEDVAEDLANMWIRTPVCIKKRVMITSGG